MHKEILSFAAASQSLLYFYMFIVIIIEVKHTSTPQFTLKCCVNRSPVTCMAFGVSALQETNDTISTR